MLRDRMLGSMMVSSASGVFRIRPVGDLGRKSVGFTFHFVSDFIQLTCPEMFLTNYQLLHLLPLDIISCFVSDGNSDPPLNALCR